MPLEAFERGFNPQLVCFDSWYASVENLKLARSLDWHFLTRLKANRQIRVGGGKLQRLRKPNWWAVTEPFAGSKGLKKSKYFAFAPRTTHRNTGRRVCGK